MFQAISFSKWSTWNNFYKQIFFFVSKKKLFFSLTLLFPFSLFLFQFSTPFEWLILITICANCIALGAQTPFPNSDTNLVNNVLDEYVENLFLVIFATECVLKIIASGFAMHPEGSCVCTKRENIIWSNSSQFLTVWNPFFSLIYSISTKWLEYFRFCNCSRRRIQYCFRCLFKRLRCEGTSSLSCLKATAIS